LTSPYGTQKLKNMKPTLRKKLNNSESQELQKVIRYYPGLEASLIDCWVFWKFSQMYYLLL